MDEHWPRMREGRRRRMGKVGDRLVSCWENGKGGGLVQQLCQFKGAKINHLLVCSKLRLQHVCIMYIPAPGVKSTTIFPQMPRKVGVRAIGCESNMTIYIYEARKGHRSPRCIFSIRSSACSSHQTWILGSPLSSGWKLVPKTFPCLTAMTSPAFSFDTFSSLL